MDQNRTIEVRVGSFVLPPETPKCAAITVWPDGKRFHITEGELREVLAKWPGVIRVDPAEEGE